MNTFDWILLGIIGTVAAIRFLVWILTRGNSKWWM